MQDKITTLLFDIDGTVLDTSEFILQATEHALRTLGYPVSERAFITKQVGKAFPDYYFALTGTNEKLEELIDTHRAFQYKNFGLAKLFPKAKETLQGLKEKGYKLAAVTTRSKKTSHQTLQDAEIFNLFDAIINNEDTAEHKPHPAPLLKALELLEEKPENAVMIGDSYIDVEAGKNTGTKTIRSTYGFHSDHLHDPEPDFIINNISELLNLL